MIFIPVCFISVLSSVIQMLEAVHPVVLPPPTIVQGRVGSKTLELEWNSAIDNVTVELRLEQEEDIWFQATLMTNNNSPEEELLSLDKEFTRVTVSRLNPYSRYLFRLRHGDILSPPSRVVRTKAAGRPGTPPQILQVSQLPRHRVLLDFLPPTLPNAEITTYHLFFSATSGESKHVQMAKDIFPKSDAGKQSFVFGPLDCNATYKIQLTARSVFGVSEPAFADFTCTCPDSVVTVDIPWVLVILNDSVYKKDIRLNSILDESTLVTKVDEMILSIDIHWKFRYLYLVTESSRILRQTIVEDTTGTVDEIVLDEGNRSMGDAEYITVDWVNNRIYILKSRMIQASLFDEESWYVDTCDLNGESCSRMEYIFDKKPRYLQVDPYYGYLYWVQEYQYFPTDSLMRVNLTRPECQATPEKVISGSLEKSERLGPFVISYADYSVYIPNLDKNLMYDIKLHSADQLIEVDTVYPTLSGRKGFHDVDALVRYKARFFWTSEQGFNVEYPTKMQYSYSYLDEDIKTTVMKLFDSSAQPYPVPLNNVEDLQAIFNSSMARIVWSEPRTGLVESCAKYKAWKYRVQMTDQTGNIIVNKDNVTETVLLQKKDLLPNQMYSIRVQAFSEGGSGPWSKPFLGKTLKSMRTPTIYWADSRNIHKVDLLGFNGMSLAHNTSAVTSIVWLEESGTLLWSSEDRILSSLQPLILQEDSVISSLAYESLGKRVYYSVPGYQEIRRISLHQGEVEMKLKLSSSAANLMVDSSLGKLCWISYLNGLECSQLDGGNVTVLYDNGIWSDQKILCAAIDPQQHQVYFILYNPLKLPKYEYNKVGLLDNKHSKLGSLSVQHIESSLYYISSKLVFLEAQRSIVTFDLEGQSISRLPLTNKILSFTLSSDARSQFPDDFDNVSLPSVIPDSIDINSLKMVEERGEYMIVWNPVNNTNFGHIRYEVNISNQIKTVDEPFFSIKTLENHGAHTSIHVRIRAVTIWAKSPAVEKLIRVPDREPNPPRNLRVFWKGVSVHRNEYTLRWTAPEEKHGRLVRHAIRCVQQQPDGRDVCAGYVVDHPAGEVTLLLEKAEYRFTVATATSAGFGPESDPFYTSSAEYNPIPVVLLGQQTPPAAVSLDVDNGRESSIPLPVVPAFMSFDARTNSVFIANKDGELYQLALETKIASFVRRLGMGINVMHLDWVGRYLYFVQGKNISRVDIENYHTAIQPVFRAPERVMNLDLDSDGKFYYSDSRSEASTFLLSRNGQATGLKKLKSDMPSDSECNCREQLSTVHQFHVVLQHQQNSFCGRESTTGDIILSDSRLCNCRRVAQTDINEKVRIQSDLSRIYILHSHGHDLTIVSQTDDSVQHFKLMSNKSRNMVAIQAICHECQDSIPLVCLKIGQHSQQVQVTAVKETAAFVQLPFPEVEMSCRKSVQLPSTKYMLSYKMEEEKAEQMQTVEYYNTGNLKNRTLIINDLHPNTNYIVCVSMMNIYSETEPSASSCSKFKTEDGPSDPPAKISAVVLSPSTLEVRWSEPSVVNSNQLKYEIHWKSKNFVNGAIVSGTTVVPHGVTEKTLEKFPANNTFQFWMTSLSHSGKRSIDSNTISIRLFAEPEPVEVASVSPWEIDLSWRNTESAVSSYQVIYYPKGSEDSAKFKPETPAATSFYKKHNIKLDRLSPSHCYIIKVAVQYKTNPGVQFIPHGDDKTCVLTTKEKPLVPGVPTLSQKEHSMIAITWKANDEAVLQYELQKRSMYPKTPWDTVYNGTENLYIPSGLSNGNYTFRVRAYNTNGYSDFSPSSPVLDLEMVRLSLLTSRPGQFTIAIICTSVIGFMLIICILFCLLSRNRFSNKKKSFPTPQPPDLELQNLRDLPHRAGFVNVNNPMYNQLEIVSDEDLATIPKIKRSQITLTKFLGSGAFGEVFEGLVKELDSEDGVETKIAVKTLRKGATDTEKIEFLKEAKLMWNFKHEHILNLNAICLDNDPNFLILELMEAGDLLSYLRAHRPKGHNQGISLLDLVEMCQDVAKGCEYLEQMHFVHRDLAARNCLVSSTNPSKRRVKIGDFGLARDVYKNDYYRKKGEGLLPVRWMAPESLMDGVFTCQSDVWSFGVLLWEILTMGGVPYPTMSNREVMLYVRSGRRLEQPPGSPKRLHELMTSCWSFMPSDRPSFKMCLQEIESLLEPNSSLSSLSTSYLTYIQNGGCGSQCSRQHFHSATTLPASQISRGRLNTLGSHPPPTPTYLQLLHEEYEMPKSTGEGCNCVETQRSNEYGNVRTTHTPACDSLPSTPVQAEPTVYPVDQSRMESTVHHVDQSRTNQMMWNPTYQNNFYPQQMSTPPQRGETVPYCTVTGVAPYVLCNPAGSPEDQADGRVQEDQLAERTAAIASKDGASEIGNTAANEVEAEQSQRIKSQTVDQAVREPDEDAHAEHQEKTDKVKRPSSLPNPYGEDEQDLGSAVRTLEKDSRISYLSADDVTKTTSVRHNASSSQSEGDSKSYELGSNDHRSASELGSNRCCSECELGLKKRCSGSESLDLCQQSQQSELFSEKCPNICYEIPAEERSAVH